MAVVADVDGASVVGEVGKDDTDVDGTREEASAYTTNRGGSNFGNVDGTEEINVSKQWETRRDDSNLPNDRCLTNTQASNEAASVDSTQVAIDTTNHEDDNTNSPDRAEESSSPNTSDTVANHESTIKTSQQIFTKSCNEPWSYIRAPPTEPI